jgi:DNA polymerase-3 subunit epsilon
VPTTAAARLIVEAVETVVPLRRCRARLGPRTPLREAPCAPAQLGVATCPCAGTITAAAYEAHVAQAVRGLTDAPASLLAPLQARMERLAAAERFEEAADVRDRAAALSAAVARQRRIDGLRRAGRLVLRWGEGDRSGGAELRDGRLVVAWGPGDRPDPVDPPPPPPLPESLPPVVVPAPAARLPFPPAPGRPGPDRPPPCPRDLADEVLCVARWLDHETTHRSVRVEHADTGLRSELPVLATFLPRHSARDP